MNMAVDFRGGAPRVDAAQFARGLVGLQEDRLRLEQAQRADERQEQYRIELGAVDFQDPDQVQQFANEHPEMLVDIHERQQFVDEQQKQLMGNASKEVFQAFLTGNQDIIGRAIDNHAELFNTVDPSVSAQDLKGIAADNPDQFRKMMAGALSETGQEAYYDKAVGISQGLPAAVQESEYFLNLPEEEQERLLQYKGRGGEDLITRNELNRANEIMKNPDAFSQADVIWAQGITGSSQPLGEALFGALSTDKANGYMDEIEEAISSHNQLNTQMNLLMDMQERGYSLKGAGAKNFMQSWFGEIAGFNAGLAEEYFSATESGKLDIARQLAQALKPVSEANVQTILKSLEGGNVAGAIQAIQRTMSEPQERFRRNRNQLIRNKAGILNEPIDGQTVPDSLVFTRRSNILEQEREQREQSFREEQEREQREQSSIEEQERLAAAQQPPTEQAPTAPVAGSPQSMSDEDLLKALGAPIPASTRLSNIQIGDY